MTGEDGRMGNDSIDDLLEIAEDIRENGYGPYSGAPENQRKDAALVATDTGTVYPGVNVEIATYSESTGAITNAVACAVQDDFYDIIQSVVVTENADGYTFSAVDQAVLDEFTQGDEPITVIDNTGETSYRTEDIIQDGAAADSYNTFRPENSVLSFSDLADEAEDDSDLVDRARDAQKHAYVPDSSYQVGTALRMEDGTVFTGYNVENAANKEQQEDGNLGLTVHGEENAVVQAVAHGYRFGDFDTLVVATDSPSPPFPCGHCRQILREFDDGSLTVIADGTEEHDTKTLDELYPDAFGPEKLFDIDDLSSL